MRMPVLSMSIRPLIGMVQALARPGNLQRLVHLADQLFLGDVVGRDVPEDGLSHSGAQPNTRCRPAATAIWASG